MTDAELERLAILVEEAGEVVQIAMKVIRHGYDSWNPFDEKKTENRTLLENEIGDLLFAIDFMIEHSDLSRKAITEFKVKKRDKIEKYLHENTTYK